VLNSVAPSLCPGRPSVCFPVPHLVYLAIGVGYVLAYAALGWLLRGHALGLSIFGNIGLLLPPIAVCVIIVRRRASWAGCHRLFWDTFAIGVGLWVIGHLGWAFEDLILQRQSWVRWHTIFSLCGGIGPLIALFARPHRGVRAEAVGNVSLVLASYGLLAAFIYSYFILIPGLVPGGTNHEVALFKLVQLNRALLFGTMAIVLVLARRTPWYKSYLWLTIGTGIGFCLRIITSLAILNGKYQSGTLYDLAWILPFLCYASAALAAPDSPAESDLVEAPVRPLHVLVSAVPVFLIPVIGYSALYLQPLGDATDSFRAFLTGLITVAGLGLLTLRLAAQGGELERAGARMRLLAAATEQTGDLILITRANGVFEHANDAFVRALGYSRHELAKLTVRDLMAHGFGAVPAQITQAARERGIWRGTVIRRRRDGSTFPAACTVVGLRDPAGSITHYVGVERDTTDELKLRDQLVHSERLSAIGELVAGVAHEINNPLQTIVGSVELMLEERTTPAMQRDLELVRREAGRAGQIVRNLLSFVRRSTPDRAAVDLNDIIRATVELRQFHLQQHNISIEMELYPRAIYALVNREEIQQIILNLLLNAEQAMALSGKGSRITLRSYPAEAFQAVEVSDDGPGVGADLTGRIFEPFFTTKDVGQGTGLGLSISHGIAAAHGGALELRSSAVGARFRLTLPAQAVEPRSEPAAAAPASETSGTHTDLQALIVDDEVPIRGMLARLLVRRGFEVHEASSGEEALAVVERTPLSVVLCDVRMPGMNGLDLFRQLTARDPQLARSFVFITGDKSSVAIEESLRDVPLLEKPFTAADLGVVLERIGLPAGVS
jgi:PAS domain S-box-containing protein